MTEPGHLALERRGSAGIGQGGDGEKRDLRRLTVDPETHSLPDSQQPQAAGVKGRPVIGQLDAVVEQHRAGPGDCVEAAHGGLHGSDLIGNRG